MSFLRSLSQILRASHCISASRTRISVPFSDESHSFVRTSCHPLTGSILSGFFGMEMVSSGGVNVPKNFVDGSDMVGIRAIIPVLGSQVPTLPASSRYDLRASGVTTNALSVSNLRRGLLEIALPTPHCVSLKLCEQELYVLRPALSSANRTTSFASRFQESPGSASTILW